MSKVLSNFEKITVLVLLLFILSSSLYLIRKNYLNRTKIAPTQGGELIEGVLSDSSASLNDSLASLTNIGLARLDQDGQIKPAVAESWEISPDGKIYKFKIKSGYSATQIYKIYESQKGDWDNVTITNPDPSHIQFILNQPYGYFLASTLKPILPYGPFKIKSQSNLEVVLVSNDNSPLSKPYLHRIVFRIFDTKEDIKKAFIRNKINSTSIDISLDNNSRSHQFNLPRHTIAFFNISKPSLSDINIRKQILEGPTLPTPVTLQLLRPNTPSAQKFSQNIQKKLALNNVKIKEIVTDLQTIPIQNVAQYDIVIYSFNAGYYDDFYPYWHSSQIPPKGMNFSQIKNKQLDRLLENVRITLDDNVRKNDFNQAKGIIKSQYLAIYDQEAPYKITTSQSIKGIDFKFSILPTDRFSFADKWYIKIKRVPK